MEMVTSCAVLSLLMVSLGYGLKLMLVSTGSGARQATETLAAADVVQQVTDDMNLAIEFKEKTATAVTFTVPDREGGDADDQPDKIRYQWWPTAGTLTIGGTTTTTTTDGGEGGLIGGLLGVLGGSDGGTTTTTTDGTTLTVPKYSFTRQLNDGTPSLVARDVRSFNFDALSRTMTPPPPADRLLFAYDAGTSTTPVNTVNQCAVSFLASAALPSGTTSFRITRVAFYMKVGSTDTVFDSSVAVTIWPATSGGVPSGSAYANSMSYPVAEVALNRSSDFQWVDFTFPTPLTLSVTSTGRYALVLQPGPAPNGSPSGSGGNQAGVAAYQFGAVAPSPPSGTAMATRASSFLGGTTWSATSLDSLRYKVYGTTSP